MVKYLSTTLVILLIISITWFSYDSIESGLAFSQIKTIDIAYEWLYLAFFFSILDNFFDYKSWLHYFNKCLVKTGKQNNISDKNLRGKNLREKNSNRLIPSIFVASFASDLFPAKMGTFSRPFLLKSFFGLRLRDGIAIHFNALFSDFSVATIICLAGLFYWGYTIFNIVFIIICLMAILASLLLLLKSSSLQGLIQRAIRLFYPIEAVVGITDLQNATYQLFTKHDFLITLLIKLFSWIAMGSCLFSVLQAFGLEVKLIECIFMVTVSSILGILSFLPGGLIIAEATLLGFLSVLKIPMDLAIVSVFIYRLFSFWIWVLIGNLVAQFSLSKLPLFNSKNIT
jgi:uncharacterized protein (TIRG00374 family)